MVDDGSQRIPTQLGRRSLGARLLPPAAAAPLRRTQDGRLHRPVPRDKIGWGRGPGTLARGGTAPVPLPLAAYAPPPPTPPTPPTPTPPTPTPPTPPTPTPPTPAAYARQPPPWPRRDSRSRPGPGNSPVLASEEEEMAAAEQASPPLPKKGALPPGPPEQTTDRLGNEMSPETPHGIEHGPPALQAPDRAACEVCGASFETRQGLSSHARSHLRQLGVVESDCSGAPISLLYALVKQRAGPDSGPPPRPRAKKAGSPKEAAAASPRPGPLTDGGPDPPMDEATESAPGFSSRGLYHPPGSPLLLKVSPALWGSPPPELPPSPLSGPPQAHWPQSEDEGPLNLVLDSDSDGELDCHVCGAWFETSKGLPSPAGAHPRHLGVSNPEAEGPPVDELPEPLQSKGSQTRLPAEPEGLAEPGLPGLPPSAVDLSLLSLPPAKKPRARAPAEASLRGKQNPAAAGTFRASAVELPLLHPPAGPEPARDTLCEVCGEGFEGRKGLSSHARSHLRQMGVTQWSVNGSPIDTLREFLKKAAEPRLIEKDSGAGRLPSPPGGDGPRAPGKGLQATRPGRPGPGPAPVPRETSLSLLATEPSTPVMAEQPLPQSRPPSGEVKPKTHVQAGLPLKTKTGHDKSSRASGEACCELCGFYFENRKALASHARAHLRYFGVTEWRVNGSPIETLSEWMKHRPEKVGAYQSYIKGGRLYTKKFRNSDRGRGGDGRVPLTLAPNSLPLMNENPGGGLGPGEAGRIGHGGERPLTASPQALEKAQERQRQNMDKFERRRARLLDTASSRGEEASDFKRKLEEVRQPPPRVRPVPSLVPRPPRTSLVKFVGNIYTLKCRFCEAEFQGPLSIQEEWVRHLQRHILTMNFSKALPEAPEAQTVAEAQ
ncbi:protein Wiz-like [Trichosurus vulpecula]|uniref:protein Wiz-like n=1 Tax=Trichosurus vulpecula TaxID=9337 RepID=UPI00186B589B|nr:protein Wiz-like [Trichosurus vulpecula]